MDAKNTFKTLGGHLLNSRWEEALALSKTLTDKTYASAIAYGLGMRERGEEINGLNPNEALQNRGRLLVAKAGEKRDAKAEKLQSLERQLETLEEKLQDEEDSDEADEDTVRSLQEKIQQVESKIEELAE